ncbi:hypothetical protein COO20_23215 [Thalassospira marina]|uniref:Uncharacterized protein n=1 Tax=Thalassospira marina TaxID=2048283 RepID=A0A2N3KET0_9PROT|nr:hypothetical protein COO20_23215 [Thalassospira marina]
MHPDRHAAPFLFAVARPHIRFHHYRASAGSLRPAFIRLVPCLARGPIPQRPTNGQFARLSAPQGAPNAAFPFPGR